MVTLIVRWLYYRFDYKAKFSCTVGVGQIEENKYYIPVFHFWQISIHS